MSLFATATVAFAIFLKGSSGDLLGERETVCVCVGVLSVFVSLKRGEFEYEGW